MFVGVISENPLFAKSPLWNRANSYARYGQIWSGVGHTCRYSYNGIFRNIGVNLVVARESDAFYDSILHSDKIKQMPVYPTDGSIQKIEDYTVVKISDILY